MSMARNADSSFKAAITLELRNRERQMLGRRVLSVTQWYESIDSRSASRTQHGTAQRGNFH